VVAIIMIAFGFGAPASLVLVSFLSRSVLMRWRSRMARTGQAGKVLLGASAVAVSLLLLTGLDREFEAVLVNASPG
jgi:cytochrome c-type biogenesis protein